MLKSLDFTILEAGNAPEALAVVESNGGPIDLLITDVVMPQTNCDQFVEQLRARIPGLKTIYMSGYSDEILSGHGVARPNGNFIQKPFSAGTLVRKIREVFGESSRPANTGE